MCGYKNMWSSWIQCSMSPTMVAKGCKLQNFCLIVSTAAHLSVKFKLTNRCSSFPKFYWKNLAYLKPPDSVQWPRISTYGLKTLLCIFWKSSGGLHDIVSEMSLIATPYANYHKLTKVARNYCSDYDKTSENCGPLRLGENARKHTAN